LNEAAGRNGDSAEADLEEAVSGPHFVAHCSSASVSVRRPRNIHEVGDVVVASVVTRRAAGWRPRCGCDACAGCQ
jgi:hypothetical protein